MSLFQTIGRFFGGKGAFQQKSGSQLSVPMPTAKRVVSPDEAMAISTQYACVKLIANAVSSLPVMVYQNDNGRRTPIGRDSRLWQVLHCRPNAYMTTVDFWNCLIPQFLLRGNAYAQIRRDEQGDLVGLYPLSSDMMTPYVDKNGDLSYLYMRDGKQIPLFADEVFHIKDMGNGFAGIAKAELMSASLYEAKATQEFATANADLFGKPSGILSIDNVLDRTPDPLTGMSQADALRQSVMDYRSGAGRLIVLEAGMKYQAAAMTPEQLQLLETRKFSLEEVCRWNGVPPILVGAPGASTWGTGIAEIMSGFYKLTLAPLLKNIEQALEMRVLTDEERESVTVEFNFDALLRGDIKTRYDAYSIAVRNGLKTRNEIRQLENDEPREGADDLTAEANLVPLHLMGRQNEGKENANED